MPDHRLRKAERLKSRKQLNALFAEGRSMVVFPIRFVWMTAARNGPYPVQVAFSVPRKRWKRAVDRNKFKRYMREAYRHLKQILYTSGIAEDRQLVVLCLYIANESCAYDSIATGMDKGLKRIAAQVSEAELS